MHTIKQATIYMALGLFLLACTGNTAKSGTKDATKAPKEAIMVFAAASLTDVLNELVDSFEVKYHVEVKTNMASSGTLARQMAQGGEPDVYISASKKWANYADSLGAFLPGLQSEIAKNDLVLISPLDSKLAINAIDSSLNFGALLGDGRLSIGDPLHVPAGKYAKQSLEYFGWFNSLTSKLLPAKDVRSALMMVELGEAPVGIVYRTDAQKSQKVKILSAFPDPSHKPIVYVGGVCKDNKVSKDFFTYIKSEETRDIWGKYGFNK